jgi:hypothetical protein
MLGKLDKILIVIEALFGVAMISSFAFAHSLVWGIVCFVIVALLMFYIMYQTDALAQRDKIGMLLDILLLCIAFEGYREGEQISMFVGSAIGLCICDFIRCLISIKLKRSRTYDFFRFIMSFRNKRSK